MFILRHNGGLFCCNYRLTINYKAIFMLLSLVNIGDFSSTNKTICKKILNIIKKLNLDRLLAIDKTA